MLRRFAELPLYSCVPTVASVSYRRRAAFILGRIALIFQNPLPVTTFFRNFAIKMAKLLQLGIKNKCIYFVLLSFFRNFAIKDGEITPSRQKKE